MGRVERPMKPDFFPVFPMHLLMDEDYEHLTREEWGSVFLLMQNQWTKEGTLPDDREKLARMARCTPEELDALRARWPKLQPVEDQPGRVAIPWLLREYRRAVGSWEEFREKQAEKGRKSAEARMNRTGTAQPPNPNHGSNHGSIHGSTTPEPHPIPSHPIPSKEETIVSSIPGLDEPSQPDPPKPKKSREPKAPKGDSLEEILQGGRGTPTWEGYWRLVATFGGQPKNPAPKTTARLYVEALKSTTPERIQAQAETLARGVTALCYLPQLAKWLEGAGYAAPDLPTPTVTPSGGPNAPRHHRSDTDDAYLAQLRAHREAQPAGPPQSTPEREAALRELFGPDGA